ncbi:(6-4)DNA photolyase [Rhizoclosmatium globosum]|uniref:(6-4)DNA photolyase n=1 Tax=Rhizoclosmatium globosum TaxID=329046 RepID=A0A1Y2CV06_9FUNG|nr:(6-4)DNA photolyase [Rhizoclosmatium globosum]|eukprot:ORY50797.1 (6-4)DNA photolyase [Rhizoclosmatium globosum]
MPVAVHWFRKALRLHDNPALAKAVAACSAPNSSLLPVYTLDPHFVKNSHIGTNRWLFFLESLQDVDRSLSESGSKLLVLRGEPMTLFSTLFDTLIANGETVSLYFEADTSPYARNRDAAMLELCASKNIAVHTFNSHTLFNPSDVIKVNGGITPIVYQSFLKVITEKMPAIQPATPTLTQVPPLSDEMKALLTYTETFGFDAFQVPSMEDIGKAVPGENLVSTHKGGEREALKRLEEYMKQKDLVCKFQKPETNPAAFQPASTTILSPYLKMGSLSARTFYHELMKVYRASKIGYTKPPVSLLGQLYWREFYYTAGYGTPNFDKMLGNPICKQIPWRTDEQSNVDLEKWATGQTGFPWIDAIMIQLKQEGWIHHLARHSVACFLTRGDLYISWERGAKVFEKLLIDADWSLNTGNWLWLSASAFFHQYFRVYGPVSFPKKYAPESVKYVRKYIPALKNFPEKYLFEPWKCPIADQKKAGCIIGKDYPKPMCDHDAVSKVNIGKMKVAYDEGKVASPPKAPKGKKRPLDED